MSCHLRSCRADDKRIQIVFLSWLFNLEKMRRIITLLIINVFFGCSDDSGSYQIIDEPISVDLENVPYPKLSDYNFFTGDLKSLTPHEDLLLYKPNSELFTDYAKKTRYIWIPQNSKANFVSENSPLNLPVGSVLIKLFYYDESQISSGKKIIETRLMIRKNEGWIFATYKWNEQQTEAYIDMNASTVPLIITHNSETIALDYAIPSEFQCFTCHSIDEEIIPIGIKPIHLNNVLNYPDGNFNQLNRWIQKGKLENNLPSNISSVVDYSDTSKTLEERTRAYFDIQCAHCHQTGGNAMYASLQLSYHLTAIPQNVGICNTPSIPIPEISQGRIVSPQNPEGSTLHYMMNTNNSFFKMPRIGRTIVHKEGVQLVEDWINSLEECD